MGNQLSIPDFAGTKRTGSIYFRLIVPLGATLLVAMLAAWAIAVLLLTNTMDRQLDERLERATALLADGQFPLSADLISRVDRLIVARIALMDQTGAVTLTTMGKSTSMAMVALVRDIPLAKVDQPTLLSGEIASESWRISLRPLPPARDQRYRYVIAASSLAGTREASRNAALWLGAAMLAATVLLAWFGNYFARSITGPVSRLADMANRIADGERDIASSFSASNEIGVLARALNGMSRRLSQYESDLAHQSHLSGLGDLAARLAHEIRNPLTAIKMQLQMLAERVSGEDVTQVKALLNEIRRMELIVESALTMADPLKLHRSSVQPAMVINELAELLRPSLAHRDIELRTDIGVLPAINADANRLKQVLLNLINNAADELDDGGFIDVGAHADEGDHVVIINVEDSGPGLGAERSDSGGRKPFGLGLGLTICNEIVAQHGGELIAGKSGTLGGAKFTIRLHMPIIQDPGLAD